MKNSVDGVNPLVQLNGIRKTFGPVSALSGVDLRLYAGEIHALMGENGAGKSTLIKVLTGFYTADAESGEMRLGGAAIAPKSPGEAQAIGIATVYQEVNLIPGLSVAENISLGRQPMRWWGVDWRAMENRGIAAVARLGLKIDVTQPLGSYSIAVQQMVAIARALDTSAKLLILDEPTASLDADEVGQLFKVMRQLREEGMALLFVTHFLDQVYAVSDRITVLRNGKSVGESLARELPKRELVAKMMGRDPVDADPSALKGHDSGTTEKSWLELKAAGRKGSVELLNLGIRRGESLGLAGLLGSGRSEIARMLFGIEPHDRGAIHFEGQPVRLKNVRASIRAGFALLPEDRKGQGILPDLSIRENLILALQARRGWFRPIPMSEQRRLTDEYMKSLRIVAHSAEQPIGTLSGGNQQKVVLARWLASRPKLLMLDEPTRGIDVGTKAEIQKLVHTLCAEGLSILFISSEIEELVACSGRVAVMRDRKKVAELSGVSLTEGAIQTAIAEGSL